MIKLKFGAPVIAFHHYCQPSIWWEQLHQAILWLWVLLVDNSHHKDPDCLPVLDCRCSCLTGVLVHTTFNNRSTWVEPELGRWTLRFMRNQQHQTGTKRETWAKKLDKTKEVATISSPFFLFYLFFSSIFFLLTVIFPSLMVFLFMNLAMSNLASISSPFPSAIDPHVVGRLRGNLLYWSKQCGYKEEG